MFFLESESEKFKWAIIEKLNSRISLEINGHAKASTIQLSSIMMNHQIARYLRKQLKEVHSDREDIFMLHYIDTTDNENDLITHL